MNHPAAWAAVCQRPTLNPSLVCIVTERSISPHQLLSPRDKILPCDNFNMRLLPPVA